MTQHAGVELPEIQGDHAAQHQHQQRQPAHQGHVQRIVRQKPEAGDHLVLGLGHDFTLAHNHLALYQHLRLHRVPGLLAVGLGDFGVDEHVRLNADANRLGVGAHQRRRIVLVQQIAGDAGDGGALLALGQRGVQGFAHLVRAGGSQLVQRRVVGLQQGGKHILGHCHRGLAVRAVQQIFAHAALRSGRVFLADVRQRAKGDVHVLQHGGVHAGIHALVAGLHGVGGGFPQGFGGHRVLHILGGVHRLAGGFAHMDVVLIRRDARQDQHEQQYEGHKRCDDALNHAAQAADSQFR